MPADPNPRPRPPGLLGHAWTIGPRVAAMLRSASRPASSPFAVEVADPRWGTVRLSGALVDDGASDTLVVLVHGLGGNADSYYMRSAAAGFAARGCAVLQLALRGADRRGEDFYHAGLATDLDVVLASPMLARFVHVHLVGFSLGGHMTLCWARRGGDPRVATVAAICSPIDLGAAQRHADSRRATFYRRYVLSGLAAMHREVAASGRLVGAAAAHAPTRAPTRWPTRRWRTFHEWDATVVVPRFGFRSVDDYYASQSVAPHLAALRVPSLIVLADGDPLVPPHVVEPFLPAAGGGGVLTIRKVRRGGHLGFPRDVDLGFGGERGLCGQLRTWHRGAR